MPNTVKNTLQLSKHIVLSLWLPLLMLIVGYFFAAHYAVLQEHENKQKIVQLLSEKLTQINTGVTEKVTLYQYGLRGTRGAVMSNKPEDFNFQLMQTYTQTRDYSLEFPGARGFGFIRYITPDQRDNFVQRARAERPDATFDIRQLTPHDDSMFVIQYIEPEQSNREAVGLDIGSESMRRNAAEDAAKTNEVRLTGPITLVQAQQKSQQGFLILLPVYQSALALNDASERSKQLFGWSYAVILIDEVLTTITGLSDDVIFSITDITEQPELHFFQRGQNATAIEQYHQQQLLNLFGRTWQLDLYPTANFIQALALPAKEQVLLEIWLVSLLLALFVFSGQLIYRRRSQLAAHKLELAQTAEHALIVANAELEQQVLLRTEQITKVSALQRSILSGAGYAIIATDIEGLITVFNPAAEKLLGYKAAEVVNKTSPALFHLPEEITERAQALSTELGMPVAVGFDTFIAKTKAMGGSDINRWTYVNKAGNHVQVKLNVSCLLNDAGNIVGFLGIAYDLTEQLNRENELAAAKELAIEASQAKSDFLANMSHEIRTPMNAILGLLQLVANTPLDKRQQEYISKTRRAAQSLLALLNDILDFSKVEAGKLELDIHPFDLPSLMHDVGILLSSNVQHKNVEILYRIAPEVPQYILGDSLRLQQVLLNLAGNAIKFTEQGEVEIAINVKQQLPKQLILQFSVRDTGIGMTDEQQKNLFGSFHQADTSISRRYGGTGLGLAICKHLVNLMQGDISATSNLHAGSTFTFTICVEQTVQPAPEALLPANLKVLIVEDNETAQIIMHDIVNRFGWKADIAASAAQAMQLLYTAGDTAYDIVFADWRLPDQDGLVLAERIRSITQLSKTPLVIMITAYGRELLDKNSDKTQQLLDAILIKPVTPEVLYKTVSGLLAPEAATDIPTNPLLQFPLSGLTLLLVEDNPTNQLVATELLQQQGAKMVCAESGEKALSLLNSDFKPDAILMDIQMPKMDGYETTRRIRRLSGYSTLPIIAMTANAMAADKAASIAAGMNDHIAKPFNLNEVVEKVLHYAGSNSLVRKAAGQKTALPTALQTLAKEHQLDLASALQRLGNIGLYGKVIKQFSEDFTSALQQLSAAPLDKAEAKLLFHSLKSAAATCGMNKLAEQLAEQETKCHQDTITLYAVSAALLSELKQAAALITQLNTAVGETTTAPPAIQANTVTAELKPQLLTLAKYLKNSNMAAPGLFSSLQPQLHAIDPGLTEQLKQLIEKLAFPAALGILKQLQQQFDEASFV
ncbi:CHASE domain-containing protein [Rheinheimera hassiensis]|uniref:CHASE domain-containing protein n=1 Tax=Rheinheimera hassiensis TaxID=1193627 RepID=UPI001F068673|nr:CHASE domain-containing protein [Rheinheimera hassiensis]